MADFHESLDKALAHTAEKDAPVRIHDPHCNTGCRAGTHYLSSGIGMPHIHQTDLGHQCGACVTPPAECGICGGPLAKVGTSRCYEAHGVTSPAEGRA